jgi:hypothetical protein
VSTTLWTVVLCLGVAALIVAAFGKRKAIFGAGMFVRDKKGRLVMVLTPAKRKRKK